jgi:hypothetical protein
MDTIKVRVKFQYGHRRLYVTGPQAEHIKALTGTVTLTEERVVALRALGFRVELEDGSSPVADLEPRRFSDEW